MSTNKYVIMWAYPNKPWLYNNELISEFGQRLLKSKQIKG